MWSVLDSTGAAKGTTATGWSILDSTGTIKEVSSGSSSTTIDASDVIDFDEDAVYAVSKALSDSGTIQWDHDAEGGGRLVANFTDYYPRTPGGRLTLTSATPVMVSEAAAQTTIYYTPYTDDVIFLHDGTSLKPFQFTEVSIAMASSAEWASGSNYDLYMFYDAGTIRLVTGSAWSTDTARSESLTRVHGMWHNAATMTGRYSASSTVSVPALQGLYVGTFRASANGTTTWELGGTAAGGDPGFLYLWNCYNRVTVGLHVLDSTDTWTNTAGTNGPRNGSTSNRVNFVLGLAECLVKATHAAGGELIANADVAAAYIGFGLDSTTSMITLTSFYATDAAATSTGTVFPVLVAETSHLGLLGFHYLQATERGATGGTGTVTFYGDGGATYIQFGISFEGTF